MQYADRMKTLGTEAGFEVLLKARKLEREGRKILHFELGEPDFDTPAHVKEAAKKALDENYTHYCPSPGVMEHREALAEYTNRTRKTDYSAEEIVVGPGGKPLIFYGMLACLNPGDEVIMPSPSYAIYDSVARLFNAKPVHLQVKEESDWRLDVSQLESLVTPKTRMIVINSPANPTGGVLTHSDLETIADVAKRKDLWVMSDEVYAQIVYDGYRHESIAALPGMKERTILIDCYSKTWAMTGWRLGWGAMPKELAVHTARLVTNSVSCTTTFAQIAGIAALKGDEKDLQAMVSEFRQRRDLIIGGLNKIDGISCRNPKGAFYAFPNIKQLCADKKKTSQQVFDFLMQEAGVSALPGTAFGPEGEGYLRFSYATKQENIREALAKMQEFLPKL